MKVIAIIQARMDSKRLPGKILAPLAGCPILKIIQNRIQSAKVDSFWLATSSRSEDDLTEHWGQALGLQVYRGDIDNVLSRFTGIVRKEKPDWVVRLTADNPFVDSDILDHLINKARASGKNVSYVYGGEHEICPLGYIPEIVRSDYLLKAESEILDEEFYHRSHVTSWIKKNSDIAILETPQEWQKRADWRWTVDTYEDYQMAKAAFKLFGEQWPSLRYQEMVKILDNHPEVTDSNLNIRQKKLEDG